MRFIAKRWLFPARPVPARPGQASGPVYTVAGCSRATGQVVSSVSNKLAKGQRQRQRRQQRRRLRQRQLAAGNQQLLPSASTKM